MNNTTIRYAITDKGRAYLTLRRLGMIKSKEDEAAFDRRWAELQKKKETAHHEHPYTDAEPGV